MHKFEIWSENSSFVCEVSGLFKVLHLCLEDKIKPNQTKQFFCIYTVLASHVSSGNHMDIFYSLHLLICKWGSK